MPQINKNSIKAYNPKSSNHKLGTDLCELGQKQPNSFDSVELGLNKIWQNFDLKSWLMSNQQAIRAWKTRNQQVFTQKTWKNSKNDNGFRVCVRLYVYMNEGDEVWQYDNAVGCHKGF